MDIQLTEQGRARFGYKVFSAETVHARNEAEPGEETPVHETRLRRLVAPISAMVEKIHIFDETVQ